MFTTMRTRKTAVELGLFLVLAAGGGMLAWGASFTTTMVHDQLSAQRITFPPAGSEALDPAKYPGLQRYAGQAVDDGPKAKAYADQFIGTHLREIAGGRTYAEVSSAARATPDDRKLAGQAQALFQGETARGLLLSAWGWSVIGRITGLAAIAVLGGAAIVLAALAIQLAAAVRARQATATEPGMALAGAAG